MLKHVELLISENAEKLVYEDYLKKMLQVKRNKLYENMLQLNKEYEKFLHSDNVQIERIKIYLQHCETNAIEIGRIQEYIKDVSEEDEF